MGNGYCLPLIYTEVNACIKNSDEIQQKLRNIQNVYTRFITNLSVRSKIAVV